MLGKKLRGIKGYVRVLLDGSWGLRTQNPMDDAKTLMDYRPGKLLTMSNLDSPSLPPGKYRILYADPPRKYFLPSEWLADCIHNIAN